MTLETRLKVAFAISAVLFFGVALMPDAPSIKPSRLARYLPKDFGQWMGSPSEPGEKEKKILAKDTEFERMSYWSYDETMAPVEVSLVFSGKTTNESIHRPEICLRAQGWEFVSERNVSMDGLLPDAESFPLREIVCRFPLYRKVEGDKEASELALNRQGEQLYRWRVFYYTFIGYEAIVSGHYERTLEDVKSRVVGGFDQRWAYATFSAPITGENQEQGIRLYPKLKSLSLEETTAHIRDFLGELLPLVVKAAGEGDDPTLEKLNSLR